MKKNNPECLRIEKRFTHEQQGAYVEIPFHLNRNISRIEVSYDILTPESVVDLGLRDTNRIRGWSGGARKSFIIEKDFATPGYLPGELEEGEWAVLLGLYKIPEAGSTVIITINLFSKQFQWFRGDLHSHTVHSDGSYSIEQVIDIGEQQDLDFIALTDHNTVSQNYIATPNSSILFIPGFELTTSWGHANFLGVKDPGVDFRLKKTDNVEPIFHHVQQQGGRVVVNHPHCTHCPWLWDLHAPFNWVEIWNGPWRKDNEKTLNWWHQQLVNGKRIVAVGGSDVHRPDPFVKHGTPTNWVYAEEKSTESILRAIDYGHLFMTYSPNGPTIDIRLDGHMMGDTVSSSLKNIEVSIKASNLKNMDEMKVISNHGIEKCISLGQEDILLEQEIPVLDQKFIRVEIWRYFEEIGDHSLALLSNPIYFDI
ncbi:CehA/McbA family metallohydrolase [Sutcliffiella horikoshii]|uniref:Phosphoesterase n=1 Tax=Sutcliffiella horikoshii TaxID=79883 RepID=A0A5D4TA45_9BACI|nr:CehA/McbA family metallohydrolase [Sutcliffiella horikoshii]TYS71771.1 phosphoesterase [Sutcliffiella horikoshii]